VRFLANENVEQPVVDSLRAAGHDVVCVGEVAPGARDEEVLRLANAESRLLLTNDKDFSELVYREGRVSGGIVLLRLETQDGRQKAARLAEILAGVEERLAGHFAVVSEERVRLRPLRRL
jgi:predicted nuclease of predicted toxin-antitoxin system